MGFRPGLIKLAAMGYAFTLFNAVVTHLPVFVFRHWYLRTILHIRVGRGSSIGLGLYLSGNRIRIGSNTVINRSCYLDGRWDVTIGDRVNISPGTYILSLTHDVNDPEFNTVRKATTIGDYVWLGVRSLVLPGVILGEGAVVGAGSVVTKNVDPYTIVAGSPACFRGVRNRDLRYIPSYFPCMYSDVQTR